MNMRQSSTLNFKRLITSTALALVVSTGFIAATVDDAYAQRAKRNNDSQQQAPEEGRQFGAKAGALVSEAQDLMGTENYAAALPKLNEALAIPDINPYERAITQQLIGNSYYNLNQYGPAINAFEAAISSGGLLPNESSALRVNIAQLLIGNDQFVRGAEMLEQWDRNGGQLKPAHVTMLYQAWLQAEQYSRALPWAKRWFDTANPKERKHFDLMNYLYNTLDMTSEHLERIKEMITIWPDDKALWVSWTAVLANAGYEREAFEVSILFYEKGGYTTERDLMKLVKYYAFYDMPYQAAEILETEIQAGRIGDTEYTQRQLAQYWKQARDYDKALRALEKTYEHMFAQYEQSGSSEDLLTLVNAKADVGQCEAIETLVSGHGVRTGVFAAKLKLLSGSCHYDAVVKKSQIHCRDYSDAESAKLAALWLKPETAFAEAVSMQGVTEDVGSIAQEWLSIIGLEKRKLDNRCQIVDNIEQEKCFIFIKRAYSNLAAFGRRIQFDDEETCRPYMVEYDALFRTVKQ